MKIYIMTDLEGVAGVLNGEDYIKPGDIFYERAVRLTTLETNAVVEGLFAGGAKEILVCDGHGWGAIDSELLDARVRLISGGEFPDRRFGLEGTFDAICFVGQHAKAGTPFSHLTHTGSHLVIDRKLNGVSIGEYGEFALTASFLGVPVFLACGEHALCEEAKTLTPWVHVIAGKRGLMPDNLDALTDEQYRKSKQGATHISPEESRAQLRRGAEAGMKDFSLNRERFRLLELSSPYVLETWWRKSEAANSLPRHSVNQHPSDLIALLEQAPNFANEGGSHFKTAKNLEQAMRSMTSLPPEEKVTKKTQPHENH